MKPGHHLRGSPSPTGSHGTLPGAAGRGAPRDATEDHGRPGSHGPPWGHGDAAGRESHGRPLQDLELSRSPNLSGFIGRPREAPQELGPLMSPAHRPAFCLFVLLFSAIKKPRESFHAGWGPASKSPSAKHNLGRIRTGEAPRLPAACLDPRDSGAWVGEVEGKLRRWPDTSNPQKSPCILMM